MSADTYKEVKVFEFPGMTARVYIPDLTPQERAKRMQAIHTQTGKFMKEVMRDAQ